MALGQLIEQRFSFFPAASALFAEVYFCLLKASLASFLFVF